MSVRFVAIVGAQDEPLYFKSAEGIPHEVEVNHQFIAEMSLDFIEQAAPQMHENLRQPMMVMLHEGIAVYALLTCTRVKYIVGVESLGDNVNIEEKMHAVADTYVGYLCNPFGSKDGKVESPVFDEKIKKIIAQ